MTIEAVQGIAVDTASSTGVLASTGGEILAMQIVGMWCTAHDRVTARSGGASSPN